MPLRPGLPITMSLPLLKSLIRMATLGAPLLPVTRASPLVMATASTLPAENASIEGTYSNHLNSTGTPSSANQPFWMPISQATQPGQSLYATRSAWEPAGATEAALGCSLGLVSSAGACLARLQP